MTAYWSRCEHCVICVLCDQVAFCPERPGVPALCDYHRIREAS